MKKEIWKTLDKYPNYQVSNHGRIRNKSTKIIMKTSRGYRGRLTRFSLSENRPRLYVDDLISSKFPEYKIQDEKEQLDGETWIHMLSIGYGFNEISDKGRVRIYYSKKIISGRPTDIGTIFKLERHQDYICDFILLSELMSIMFPDVSIEDYAENDIIYNVVDPGYKSIKAKCPLDPNLCLPNEKWKILLRFPKYLISNTGRIYGPSGKILKFTLNGPYYATSIFMYTGELKRILVHQLIIWAFKPRIEGLTVDHIDRDCKNNHIDNLRYATRSEQNYNQKPYKRDIVYNVSKVSRSGKIIKIWQDRKSVAEELGISLFYLSNIIIMKNIINQ